MSRYKCIYPNCQPASGEKVSFHELPSISSDAVRRRLWLKHLQLTEGDLKWNSRVCTKHFDECYVTRLSTSIKLNTKALPVPVCKSSVTRRSLDDNRFEIRHESIPVIIEEHVFIGDNVERFESTDIVEIHEEADSQPGPSGAAVSQLSQESIKTVTSSEDDNEDSDYIPSPEERYINKTITSNLRTPATDSMYMVLEPNLRQLFRRCHECGKEIKKDIRIFDRSGHIRVEYFCDDCGEQDWHSFPHLNAMSYINLLLPAATITAGASFVEISKIAAGLKLAIPSEREYYYAANEYLYPSINDLYLKENQKILDDIRIRQFGVYDPRNDLCLAIDTRYSHCGHSAKLATTSAMDLETNHIIASITTVKKIDQNSTQALELYATEIILDSLMGLNDEPDSDTTTMLVINSNSIDEAPKMKIVRLDVPKEKQLQPISIGTVVTDDHSSLIKAFREKPKYAHINHQSDIWHFIKRIKKRLSDAAKSVSNRELYGWIKLITNFVKIICEECHGDVEMLEELWRSHLYHIRGIHSWPHDRSFKKVHQCLHDQLPAEQQNQVGWLHRSSPAYKVIKLMINDPKYLATLRRCDKRLHTSLVESMHSSLLPFLPKRKKFETLPFIRRVQMAQLDFNENIDRPPDTTETGSPKTRLVVPPSTGEPILKTVFVDRTQKWRTSILEDVKSRRIEKSSIAGHTIAERTFIMEPSQRSFVEKPPREILEQQYRKRKLAVLDNN